MSAVELATPADAPHLTEIFLAAFSNAFNRRLFPPTAEVREWFAANVLNGTGTAPENEIVVKIADPTTGELAGFAKWVRVAGATGGDRKGQKLSWPESSDRALCDLFFGTMEKDHARIMGGREHYYLDLLGVHPAFQGRGVGAKLLNWGLARADREKVEVYLSSSPEGNGLYVKNGFQVLDSFTPFPGYEQVNMVRPVQN